MPDTALSWKCYFRNESGKLVHSIVTDTCYDAVSLAHQLAGKLFQDISVTVIGEYFAYQYTVDAFQTKAHSDVIALITPNSDFDRFLLDL